MVILDAVCWPSHLSVFETWNASDDALLHILRHAVRNAVRVDEIWTYRGLNENSAWLGCRCK